MDKEGSENTTCHYVTWPLCPHEVFIMGTLNVPSVNLTIWLNDVLGERSVSLFSLFLLLLFLVCGRVQTVHVLGFVCHVVLSEFSLLLCLNTVRGSTKKDVVDMAPIKFYLQKQRVGLL